MHDSSSPTSDLIPLIEVPSLLPRRAGRAMHVSTVYRWAQQGVAGVRLNTCRIGGLLFTSRHSLDAFIDRLSRQDHQP